jgi:hypothetical protein
MTADVKHLLVRYIIVLAVMDLLIPFAWSGWYMRHRARDLCWEMVNCNKI